ncbi:MAG: YceH family protein [Planctomycetes bacterium]|nr:YceH family protein [Planctomycetota bacterium]
MMSTDSPAAEAAASPRWRPLEALQRRVLGVLVEKAKTTPEAYPLSLNALRTGCNQKNNRSPLMQLEELQVEEALDELRKLGAVAVVQGGGRVDRYRHLAYEWLGVEKVELAVMTELLLRGSQTVGELRGRAARMEPIKDLSDLRPTLDALKAKGLIQYLTPPGRGSVVTHSLYLDREMEKVRREAGHVAAGGPPAASGGWGRAGGEPPEPAVSRSIDSRDSYGAEPLREQLDSLRDELAAVKRELEAARSEFATVTEELRRDFDTLNRQLGN